MRGQFLPPAQDAHSFTNPSIIYRMASETPIDPGNQPKNSSGDTLKSSFKLKFINPTTALILEDDSYFEQPLIYVKIYPDFLIITDTGTNSPREKQSSSTSLSLRRYLETVPVQHPAPHGKYEPLNAGGKKRYVIICTHAHYDHILGIPAFLDATPPPFIVASGNDPSFVTKNLPTHSLCKYLHIPTPVYMVNHWTEHLEYVTPPGLLNNPSPSTVDQISNSLGFQFLHIPGHTPDSLAWYDVEERHLYIGDMLYQRKFTTPKGFGPLPEQDAAIIFPAEGNWISYLASLDSLIRFTSCENTRLKLQSSEMKMPQRVKLGCGHVTYAGDAENMAREVRRLFERILKGKVPVVRSFVKRGLLFDVWKENEPTDYIVEAPRKLCEDAKRERGLVDAVGEGARLRICIHGDGIRELF